MSHYNVVTVFIHTKGVYMFNSDLEPGRSIEQMARIYAMREISQEFGPKFKQVGLMTKRSIQYSIRGFGAALVTVGRKMEQFGRMPRSTAPLTE